MILALTILFALLQIGDWYTTRRNIEMGGKELNPVMRQAIKQIGLAPAFALKGLATTAMLYTIASHSHWAVMAAGCALYAAVVIYNYRG